MYIELNRRFLRLSEEEVSSDEFEIGLALGLSQGRSWEHLLEEYRVVLLASAGTGKTEEIRHQCEQLRKQGAPAFFVRLEHLTDDWKIAFDAGTHDELATAIAEDKEFWLFLDSVDEARLANAKDFERAIRHVGSKIGNALQRGHIFITSRVGAWRAKSDAELIARHLPYKPPKNPEDEQSNADQNYGPSGSIVNYYTLRDLSSEQIMVLSGGLGMTNANEFVLEIERNDVTGLASTPRDVEELVAFWKQHDRLGGRFELVDNGARRKLVETDPDRAKDDPLTAEKAWDGAMRLAAAVALTRQTRILLPDADTAVEGLRISDILTGWTTAECAALLARPIFEPETYGFVRFHLRDTMEYLAATWFEGRLVNGASRQSVEGLFFTNQYGIDVVIPRLRSVLPWLAILDERMQKRLVEKWPEVLFEGGDPSRLPKPVRKQLLENICSRYAENQTARISVDLSSLQRLARPDVSETIRGLDTQFGHVPEIKRFILRAIEVAPMRDCVDIALASALDASGDRYTWLAGCRALVSTARPEDIQAVSDTIVSGGSLTERTLVSDFVQIFGPKYISARDLVALLENIEAPNEHHYDGLNNALRDYLLNCSQKVVAEVVKAVALLLTLEPFVERRHFEVSQRNAWMLNFICVACERLVERRDPTALETYTLVTISMISLSRHYEIRDEKTKLRELVPAWKELNYALFWFDVADCRRFFERTKGERLVDWWRARIFRDYWAFEVSDFETVVEWIEKRDFIDDKLVALTLAFQLYVDASRPAKWRKPLKDAVAGVRELEGRLKKLFHPPSPTEQQKSWKRSEAQYERRRRERAARIEANNAKWKEILPSMLDKISNRERAPEGKYWVAQQYLFERMQEFGKDRDKWAYWNWRDLIPDHGEEVATAMRDGLMAEWRNFIPEIASEVEALGNSTPRSEVMGLSGLEIESREFHDWPEFLSEKEARHAARYLFSELNGFPTWIEKLNDCFPSIFQDALLREVKWDLFDNPSGDNPHYVLSDIVWHAPWLKDQIAPSLLQLIADREPVHSSNLVHAISLLMGAETVSDDQVSGISSAKVGCTTAADRVPIWYAAWVSVDPTHAIPSLREFLAQLEREDATNAAILFINALYGSRSERGIGGRYGHKKPEYLKDLYLLMHEYISRDEDIERAGGGVYTPTARDDAQDARNRVFSDLLDLPGKDAFDALMEIARRFQNGDAEVWMRTHAVKRAELDAEGEPWDSPTFVEFADTMECRPKTHRQLYDLACFRLQDLKASLEDGDTSTAEVVIKTHEETVLRNYFADWLLQRSNNNYSVPQEEELPDAKRTDIRVHGAGILGPVPIELKIADKWTGSQLFERFENQLCGDYLRDADSSNGVFFLVYRGEKKTWQHPTDRRKLKFEELIDVLQEHAAVLVERLSNVANLKVIGIDLTKRGFGKKARE